MREIIVDHLEDRILRALRRNKDGLNIAGLMVKADASHHSVQKHLKKLKWRGEVVRIVGKHPCLVTWKVPA